MSIARELWASLGVLVFIAHGGAAAETATWSDHLDHAYVYSSADATDLRARLEGYGREIGMPLEEHIARNLSGAEAGAGIDEDAARRSAIAHLLLYLAEGDPESLSAGVVAVRPLAETHQRRENRYWYHYILAHEALANEDARSFVGELFAIWLHVIAPLETSYEMLQSLSLGGSRRPGFASALPHLFENVSRMILIRSQRMGLDRGLDPLSVLVRLLYDGRVGAHPEAIPIESSSREYLRRIVERLDGPESDGGRLTFTLALFEAGRDHAKANSLLASSGFSPETLEAIRVASGAYRTALDRAQTVQGRCAVHTRVLRQMGEVYAAKQRLGVDPDVETPVSIEAAIEVYSTLQREGRGGGWTKLGFRPGESDAWLDAMQRLWVEIQETSLNAADFHLARSLERPHRAREDTRSAARILSRYLLLFDEFATRQGKQGVPDSAFFAAYEAARGFGDALLALGPNDATREEVDVAIERYLAALRIFPFDRKLWSALAVALERRGQESLYLRLVRPIAEPVARSRQLDLWIESGEPAAEQMDALRQALSDDLVLMYLGFARSADVEDLEEGFVELRERRDELDRKVVGLREEYDRLVGRSGGAAPASRDQGIDASGRPTPSRAGRRIGDVERELSSATALLEKLEMQIAARSRALSLYRASLATADLARELRSRRDHPVHTLLRRMYHEANG